MATTVYGIRIKVTPDNSGANPTGASTVLYRSTTSGGTYAEVARQRGSAVWYYDDTLPLGSGKKYYKVRTEFTLMTESSYIGPVDAEPTDLQVEV